MKLHPEAQKLTSFITAFRRYVCSRLPLRISSNPPPLPPSPEIFQRETQRILKGVNSIVCEMDDILVHGSDVKQHDRRLRLCEIIEYLATAYLSLLSL